MSDSKNQAIVDLLLLAIYQDGHLSIAEDSMLNKALRALNWQEHEQSGPSVSQAFAEVRKANASEEAREEFLKERIAQVKEEGSSTLALEWLGKVLGSDGLEREESLFLERVRKELFA